MSRSLQGDKKRRRHVPGPVPKRHKKKVAMTDEQIEKAEAKRIPEGALLARLYRKMMNVFWG